MQYRVKTNKTSLGNQGDVLDEKDVPAGINLTALVEAGHLEVAPTMSSKTTEKE